MPYRHTSIFGLTTQPTALTKAQPHSGGWTESFWTAGLIDEPSYNEWAANRAALLPKQAAIVGRRSQLYTIAGNKLLPGGSANLKFLFPGNNGYDCDVPQMALEATAGSRTTANVSRFTLRGIPDAQVTNGEYQPTAAFNNQCDFFFDLINTQNLSFVARDLGAATSRINSVGLGIVTTAAPLAGVVANQTYVRFFKCRTHQGLPVKGSYLVTLINGNSYTLQGLDQLVQVSSSGQLRVDTILLCGMKRPIFSRIVVKKIGRPSQSYRGRASKRR